MNKRWILAKAAAVSLIALTPARAADKPYDGVTLTLASQNDQFATVLADLAPSLLEEPSLPEIEATELPIATPFALPALMIAW